MEKEDKKEITVRKPTAEDAGDMGTPLLELGHAPEEGTVPPFSMRTIMLLEKINSPFVREPEPERNPVTGELIMAPVQEINPKTGEPAVDEMGEPIYRKDIKGEPLMAPVMVPPIPTIQEIVEAFFVVMKQEDPRILQIIRDDAMWESTVLQYGGNLTPSRIAEITGQLNERMAEVNQAAARMKGGGTEKK